MPTRVGNGRSGAHRRDFFLKQDDPAQRFPPITHLQVDLTTQTRRTIVCGLGGRDLCAFGTSRFLLGCVSFECATTTPKRATPVGQTAAWRRQLSALGLWQDDGPSAWRLLPDRG